MNQEENEMDKDMDFTFVEIQEFKSEASRNRQEAGGRRKRRRDGERTADWPSCFIYGGSVLWFAAVLLLGVFQAGMPVILVCALLLLEIVIGVCLHGTPVWVHGLEMLVGIAAGILFGRLFFMAGAALVYLSSVLALHRWRKKE